MAKGAGVITVVGCVADEFGHASQTVVVPANIHTRGRSFDVKKDFFAVPSTEYRSVQASAIAVDVDHDPARTIGALKYLELSRSGDLHAVCELDAAGLEAGPWAYSPYVHHRGGTDVELHALSVTRQPAQVGIGNLTAFPGTLRDAARQIVYQDGWQGRLVKDADAYDRRRKRGEPITIVDHRPQSAPAVDTAPAGPLEYRSASRVDVSKAARVIELIAVPYNTDAVVPVDGRMVYESFSNTAFANVDRQPNRDRIHVTRDHDLRRLVGRVAALDPFHADGLKAELKIAATRLGDETITLARDQLLDASIGFKILPNGQTWESRTRRRVTRAHLAEVSLVPEPAYAGTSPISIRAR